MHSIQRIGAVTAMLVLAAGTSALATVTIEPSHSITLATHGRGTIFNSDLEREITITVMSNSGSLHIADNGCGALVKIRAASSGGGESRGSGQASESKHNAVFHITSTSTSEGSCVVKFSDGSHTANLHIRLVKP